MYYDINQLNYLVDAAVLFAFFWVLHRLNILRIDEDGRCCIDRFYDRVGDWIARIFDR